MFTLFVRVSIATVDTFTRDFKKIMMKSQNCRNQGFLNFFACCLNDPDPYKIFLNPDPGDLETVPEHCLVVRGNHIGNI